MGTNLVPEIELHLTRIIDRNRVVKFNIYKNVKITNAFNTLVPNIKCSNTSGSDYLILNITQHGIEIHDGNSIIQRNKITYGLLKVQEEAFKEIVIETSKLYGLDDVKFDKEDKAV